MNKKIKVCHMNDFDWVAAKTLKEAVDWYVDSYEIPRDECCDDPCEVSEARLRELKFYLEYPGKGNDISFYERLQNIIKEGREFPCLFASTEW